MPATISQNGNQISIQAPYECEVSESRMGD